MCEKTETVYSLNNYYLEQIAALTLQSKGAMAVVMHLARQMNEENIVYCHRDELCDATGGKLRSVTAWITSLQKYGFIYVVRKDKDGWEFAVNPALIVKGTPDKNRTYPMWPKDLFITGPVMDSHSLSIFHIFLSFHFFSLYPKVCNHCTLCFVFFWLALNRATIAQFSPRSPPAYNRRNHA